MKKARSDCISATIKAGARAAGSIALALGTAQAQAEQTTQIKIEPDGAALSPAEPKLVRSDIQSEGTPHRILLPGNDESYSPKAARRFKALAVKRALNTATPEEQTEFADLQMRRRRAETFSPDEVLAEHRRRQFVIQMVDLISRHVTFFKPEDQARAGSLRQTH